MTGCILYPRGLLVDTHHTKGTVLVEEKVRILRPQGRRWMTVSEDGLGEPLGEPDLKGYQGKPAQRQQEDCSEVGDLEEGFEFQERCCQMTRE